ncbi:hypothetical protein ACJMK2_036942 [Sinanodonta woodiana]|uniref:Uncharacterized protein n=1 Tax=Sinanodonta woodiana TaxID=1069815 RepID=A0ABD3WKU6_SINWO
MMKRLGTKRLWSPYSFKGRKGKKAFQDILLCRVLISTCLKNSAIILVQIDFTNHLTDMTHKYKVSKQMKEITSGVEEETNSDS